MPGQLNPDRPKRTGGWLLRRADQLTIGSLTLLGLVAMAGYWFAKGGHRGQFIDIDQAAPLEARFEVDLNDADWPELSRLPEVGETLARRIVESRQREGPFADHEDLLRVRGIGPKTLETIRPYLRAMPAASEVAGP